MSDTQHAGQEAKLSDKNFPVTDGENNRNMRTRKVGTPKARVEVNMMGDPRELHSETKHILSPAEWTQRKVDTIEEYPTEDNMSNALNTGQELRYVVKQVTGDSDKQSGLEFPTVGQRE